MDTTMKNEGYKPLPRTQHHYDFPVQPLDYVVPIIAEMDGVEGAFTKDIIKYISRWHRKNGIEDLEKAKDYLERLIEYELTINSQRGE